VARAFSAVITGQVLVSKMPGVHAGDLRKVHASFDQTMLKLLAYSDCLVFSQKRDGQPLFNKLACADLDGDHFQVIWDEAFLDVIPNFPPTLDAHSRMKDHKDKDNDKSETVKKKFKSSVLKTRFVGQNDQEFLGLIADHLIQLADLSDLNVSDGTFAP